MKFTQWEEQRKLRYGQIIKLVGIKIQNDQYNRQGILMTKGFADKYVFCLSLQQNDVINNYRKCLFKIMPKGDLLIHDEYEKKTEKEDKQLLAKRLEREEEQYIAIYKAKLNTPITFGDDIILQHIDSRLFLCASDSSSQSAIDSYKLKLKQRMCSGEVFSLQPSQNFENEGDFIYADTPILLKNNKTKCYLDFSLQSKYPLDQKLQEDAKILQMLKANSIQGIDLTYKYHEQQRLEATITNNKFSVWVFQIYQQPTQILQQPSLASSATQGKMSATSGQLNESAEIWKSLAEEEDEQYIYPYDIVQFYNNDKKPAILSSDNLSQVVLSKIFSQLEGQTLGEFWEIQSVRKFSLKNVKAIQTNNTSEGVTDNSSQQQSLLTSQIQNQQTMQSSENSQPTEQLLQTIKSPLKISQISKLQGDTSQDKPAKADTNNYYLKFCQNGQFICMVTDNGQYKATTAYIPSLSEVQQAVQQDFVVKIITSKQQLSGLEEGDIASKAVNQVQSKNRQSKVICQNQSHVKLEVSKQALGFGEAEQQLRKSGKKLMRIYRHINIAKVLQSQKDKEDEVLRFGAKELKIVTLCVSKLCPEAKYEVLFIESTMELFSFFAKALQVPEEAMQTVITLALLKKVVKNIKKLLVFILQCKISQAMTSTNIPIERRQNQVVKMRIHVLLAEIIYLMQQRRDTFQKIFGGDQRQGVIGNTLIIDKLEEVFSFSHRLIEAIISRNEYAKLKVSQFINLFFQSLFLIEDVGHIFTNIESVRDCVSELFHDNQEAVKNIITRSEVINLIQRIFKNTPNQIYPRMLSMLCVCDQNAMIDNQLIVIHKFFNFKPLPQQQKNQQQLQGNNIMNLENSNLLTQSSFNPEFQQQKQVEPDVIVNQDYEYSFKLINGKVHVHNIKLQGLLLQFNIKKDIYYIEQQDNKCWITIRNFYNLHRKMYDNNVVEAVKVASNEEQRESFERQYKYFLQLMHLLSNVSRSRNAEGKRLINSILKIEMIYEALHDPEVPGTGAFAAFMRILYHCYIDQYPNQLLNLQDHVFIWENVPNFQLDENFIYQCLINQSSKSEDKDEQIDQDILKQYKTFDSIWTIIKQYLNNFNSFANNLDYSNLSKNLELATTLQATFAYIKFGLINNIHELKNIVPCLLKIISFANELQNKRDNKLHFLYDEHQDGGRAGHKKIRIISAQKNEEIVRKIQIYMKKSNDADLIIDCKLSALKILDLLMSIETKLTVNQAITQYKESFNNALTDIKSNNDKIIQEKFSQFSKEKWQGFLIERVIFQDLDNQQLEQLVLSFTEMSVLSENPSLCYWGQTLLYKYFSNRRHALNQLKQIDIVVGEVGQEIVNELREANILISKLKNYNYFLMKDEDKQQVIQKLMLLGKAIQSGFFSKRMLKKKQNASSNNQAEQEQQQQQQQMTTSQMVEQENFPDDNSLMPVRNECEHINEQVQYLFIRFQLHVNMIQFIKFLLVEPSLFKKRETVRQTLRAVYFYLTRMVIDHSVVKQEFLPMKEIFFDHLEYNVGAVEFIRELYTDQIHLLSNDDDVEFTVNEVFTAIIVAKNYIHKALLMDLLRSFIVVGDNVRKNVVFYIMIMLQKHQLQSLIRDDQNVTDMIKQSVQEHLAYQDGLTISDQLTYFLQKIYLFSLLVTRQNNAALTMFQRFHSIQYLLDLLQKSRGAIVVKRALRQYINNLYYKQDNLGEHYVTIIQQDICSNIINDIQEYIQFLNSPMCTKFIEQPIKIKNAIRFQNLQTYYFLNIIDVLQSLTLLFKCSYGTNISKSNLKQDKFKEKILHLLSLNINNQQNKQQQQIQSDSPAFNSIIGYQLQNILWKLVDHLVNLSKQLKVYNLQFSAYTTANYLKNILQEFEQQSNDQLQHLESVNNLDSVRELIMINPEKPDHQAYEQKQMMKSQQQIGMKKLEHHYHVNNYYRSMFLNQISQNNQYINEQTFIVSDNIQQLQKYAIKYYDIEEIVPNINEYEKEDKNVSSTKQQQPKEESSQVCNRRSRDQQEQQQKENNNQLIQQQFSLISEQNYIRNMIQDFIENPENLSQEIKIQFINILIYRVENKVICRNSKYQWWESKQEIENLKDVSIDQAKLLGMGVVELVESIFHSTEGEDKHNYVMIKKGFMLGIALLLGGNTEVQQHFYQIFLKDVSNTFILQIITIIKHLSKEIRHIEILNNQRNSDSANEQDANSNKNKNPVSSFTVMYACHDNLDHFNQEDLAMEKHKSQFSHTANTSIVSAKKQSELSRIKSDEKHNYMQDNQEQEGSGQQSLFKDILMLGFRFIQLLCENNNIEMKKFLVRQISEDGSVKRNMIDFITETNNIIRKFLFVLNSDTLKIIKQLITFLVEVTQFPCVQNQYSLCKCTFIDDVIAQLNIVNQIEKKKVSCEFYDQMIKKYFDPTLDLINNMIESEDQGILDELAKKLDQGFLIHIMIIKLRQLGIVDAQYMSYHLEETNFFQPNNRQKEDDGLICNKLLGVINIVKIRNKFEQYNLSSWVKTFDEMTLSNVIVGHCISVYNATLVKRNISQQQKLGYNFQLQPIIKYIQDNLIKKLEIQHKGKQIKVEFPYHLVFKQLGLVTQEEILLQVDRITHRDKIISLLEFKDQVQDEIDYNYRLSKYYPPMNAHSIEIWKKIACLLSVIVNVLIIIFGEYSFQQSGANVLLPYPQVKVIQILSIALLEASLILIVFYCINKYPLKKHVRKDSKAQQLLKFTEKGTLGLTQVFVNYLKKKRIVRTIQNNIIYRWTTTTLFNIINFILQDDDIIYLILFVLGAILGTLHKETFFVLQLPYVIGRIPFIKTMFDSVQKAIVASIKMLLLIFILVFMYLFIFSIISYDNYFLQLITPSQLQQAQEQQTGKQTEGVCQSIFECMIQFILSGQLGSYAQPDKPSIIFLDSIYQILFVMLFLNIITGILLDTFAKYREERNAIEQDTENYCFICNLEKSEIEKSSNELDGQGQQQQDIFAYHCNVKHNIWNYIFFIYCIERKDSTQLTGMEYWIKSLLEKGDISWVPELQQNDDQIMQKFEETKQYIDYKFSELMNEIHSNEDNADAN